MRHDDPTPAWEVVNREVAQAWLATSPGNRNLRWRSVARWTEDMKAGRWHQNGETIKFDKMGRLRDGHHRLTCIAQADVQLRMLVVRGVSDDAVETVDDGGKRTPNDKLTFLGEKNANAMAAALSWQSRYEKADKTLPGKGTAAMLGADVRDALLKHPLMREAASKQGRYEFARRLLSPGLMAFCIYNSPGGEGFWECLDSGERLSPGSPILLLRNRLIEDAASKQKLPLEEKLAITIKAYCAWAAGRPLLALRWRTKGDKAEDFPRWPTHRYAMSARDG
jgi:hypothetical protein